MIGSSRARSTRQGRAVLGCLQRADGFLTAQDIHAQLRADGEPVGLTTVYRHLQALADEATIDEIKRRDGQAVYRFCATPEHHHHLVCRHCGNSTTIDEPSTLDGWVDQVAARAGFSQVDHTLEIFGLCPRCSHPRPGG